MVDCVLKIGGSLFERSQNLKKLCKALGRFSKSYSIIITSGGSRFADLVRDVDAKFHLDKVTSHKMAILAVDQYGILLSNLIPKSTVTYDLSEAVKPRKTSVIFLPSKVMFQENPLEASWNVTSDSIAAYIAHLARAEKLILAKDVDGIFTEDPKKSGKATLIQQISAEELRKAKYSCVDSYLPGLLLKLKLNCYIVNGNFPSRIWSILEGKPVKCSKITVR